ncbi:MAG: MAPEG family protein [Neomegalonema sp.]|nr:MAPEG family protein [Neomegalonema sp.]
MTYWILAALLIYFLQLLPTPILRFFLRPDPKLKAALGPRDDGPDVPPITKIGARFLRAQHNYTEALMLFLPVALLIEMKGVSGGMVDLGAALFIGARAIYAPIYASGVPAVRSLVWTVGHTGVVLLIIALLNGI